MLDRRLHRIRWWSAALPLTAALALSACGDSPEAAKAKKEAGEAVDAVGEYLGKTRDEWTQGLRESLADYEDEIQGLKDAAREKGAALSDDTRALIDRLEEKAGAARESLSKLNENKGEVWDALKGGAEGALGELGKAVDEAKERMK